MEHRCFSAAITTFPESEDKMKKRIDWSDVYMATGTAMIPIALILYEFGLMWLPSAMLFSSSIAFVLGIMSWEREEKEKQRRRDMERKHREYREIV